MKKIVILAVLFVSGCYSANPYERAQQQQDWQNFCRQWNENTQRQLDRQYYGNTTTVYPAPQDNPNYWQENYARQQYQLEQQRELYLRTHTQGPTPLKPLPMLP